MVFSILTSRTLHPSCSALVDIAPEEGAGAPQGDSETPLGAPLQGHGPTVHYWGSPQTPRRPGGQTATRSSESAASRAATSSVQCPSVRPSLRPSDPPGCPATRRDASNSASSAALARRTVTGLTTELVALADAARIAAL